MGVKHLALGGVPASLVAALVATLTKGHIHLTTDESVFYGGLAFGLGTGLAHRIEQVGLLGLFRGILRGNQPKP